MRLAGLSRAISSISMPPAPEATTITRSLPRSSTSPRYSSRSIAIACSTYSRCTSLPRGPVCSVTNRLPSSASAARPTSSSSRHSLIPPALPRAPVWTCAFTTQRSPPISCTRYAACSGLYASPPLGTAMPNPARNSFA